MFYIIHDGIEVFNVDNDEDLNRYLSKGFKQLSTTEIKAAGMEGYEQYVSPLTAKVDASGKITFTPPVKEELDKQAADSVRSVRDAKLQDTDKYLLPDFPVSADELVNIKAYRQELRDITKQSGFPSNITWPKNPMED